MPYVLPITVMLCALAGSAHAQPPAGKTLQRWVDDQGHVHYGDAPPPTAAGRQRDILDKEGRRVGVIEKPKTEEEKAEEARKAEQEAQQQRAKREAAQRDRYLVTTYKDERELLAARDERLRLLDAAIAHLSQEIAAQEKEYAALRAEAADLERAGKQPSETTQAKLGSYERELRAQRAELKARQGERTTAERRFADDLQRFRELKGATARPAASAP